MNWVAVVVGGCIVVVACVCMAFGALDTTAGLTIAGIGAAIAGVGGIRQYRATEKES